VISVLAHFYDLDRAFDRVLNRSLPYLIFPPKEFRVELGDKIGSLYQYFREGNSTAFSEQRAVVELVLTNAVFDDITERRISTFTQIQQPLDKTLSDLDERVAKLERSRKPVPKNGRKTLYNGSLGDLGADLEEAPGKQAPPQASFGTRQDPVASGSSDSESGLGTKYSRDQPVISRVIEFLKSHKGPHTPKEIANEIGASSRGVRGAVQRELESNGINGEYIRTSPILNHFTSVMGTQITREAIAYSWVENDDPDPPEDP
jgi:hypothetical protein